MRQRDEIARAMRRHGETVLRACSVYLREKADCEDVFQETFLRYAKSDRDFASDEHVKAWLIRVAANLCKDQLKVSARHATTSLSDLDEERLDKLGVEDSSPDDDTIAPGQVTAALGQIDERYRMVLFLKYYQQYKAADIGVLLGIPENTVYTYLSRGKKQMKGVLTHGR